MKLNEFSRIKAYRKNGRLSVILKLSLPKITDGAAGEAATGVFNAFYASLAEAYVGELTDAPFNTGNSVARVTVDFTDITDEYTAAHPRVCRRCKSAIVILRRVSITAPEIRKELEYTDIYDTAYGFFVK